jgi:hypothetical protein
MSGQDRTGGPADLGGDRGWLDDFDPEAADRLSLVLHHVALGILRLTNRALADQGALVGAVDCDVFVRTTGRCDGLHEAHDYVADLAAALYKRSRRAS